MVDHQKFIQKNKIKDMKTTGELKEMENGQLKLMSARLKAGVDSSTNSPMIPKGVKLLLKDAAAVTAELVAREEATAKKLDGLIGFIHGGLAGYGTSDPMFKAVSVQFAEMMEMDKEVVEQVEVAINAQN